jgi:hypothetical protein
MTLSDQDAHALKNHLAILLGYAELLAQEAAPDDPRRADFEEMQKAALAAVRLLSRHTEQG